MNALLLLVGCIGCGYLAVRLWPRFVMGEQLRALDAVDERLSRHEARLGDAAARLDERRLEQWFAVREACQDALERARGSSEKYAAARRQLTLRQRIAGQRELYGAMVELRSNFVAALEAQQMSYAEYSAITAKVFSDAPPTDGSTDWVRQTVQGTTRLLDGFGLEQLVELDQDAYLDLKRTLEADAGSEAAPRSGAGEAARHPE